MTRPWHLYILRTACGRLYTGVTTDVPRRLDEHAHSPRGARALRARGPLETVYQVQIGSRGLALRAEYRIKRLPRERKQALVAAAPDGAELLAMLGFAPPLP